MENVKKWYQKPSNIAIAIACLILIPMLLINLYIIYQAKTNKDEVPSILGYKPFIVLSGSMETEIHRGDLIFVKEVEPSELEFGDIIAFRDAENTITTHRIIEIVEKYGVTYFITKGDNNDSQDQNLVEFEDVEGIYAGRIPNLGNIMNSLAEPTTILILGLGITVIFVIGYSISNKKLKDEERREFLEYKRLKELEELEQQKEEENTTKKTTKKVTKKPTESKVTKEKKAPKETKEQSETKKDSSKKTKEKSETKKKSK